MTLAQEESADCPAAESVLEQLERILNNGAFAASDRRKAFLRYVVEEALAGRAGQIKGFSIAVSVLGRDEDFDPQTDPVVRLEARRLRRELEHYYLTEGRDDPIQITIPKGAYVPDFEWNPLAAPAPAKPPTPADAGRKESRPLRLGLLAFVAVGCLALGGLGTWLLFKNTGAEAVISKRLTGSPEAYAMFLETRQIGRPPSNETRVRAALDLAREVVRLDPDFGGGYAAESFLVWVYVVFGHSKSPEADAARALQLAETAVQVDPGFSWGYQSLSRARHLTGDLDGAVTAAEYAVDIEPEVAELQGNLGMILTLAGRPVEAFEPLQTAIRLSGENARVPYRNYLGISYFHAGKLQASIEVIEKNRRLSGPMGPHMYAYLAAAYAKIGNEGRAHAAAEHIRSPSSGFSVRGFIENLFHDAKNRQLLFSALERAGLDPADL